MKTRTKEILAAALSLLALGTVLFFATRILTPKRFDYGSTWGQFLKEPENSLDVLFFGTSKAYCDVVPPVIWAESGLRTYVLAGAEQTMPTTYYSVCEALKTQDPRAIFVEVSALTYPRHTNYTQINLGYLPNGGNKWRAIRGEAEDGQLPGYLFPLYFYHSRWDRLKPEDWRIGLNGYETDPLAGYTFLSEYRPMAESLVWKIAQEPEDFTRNLHFLQKIADLCTARGIAAVFYCAPSKAIYPGELPTAIPREVAALTGARFVDFNDDAAALGLDESRDYFDFLHFNYAGASKFSAYLADWMQAQLPLSPAESPADSLWRTRAAHWDTLAQTPLTPRKQAGD